MSVRGLALFGGALEITLPFVCFLSRRLATWGPALLLLALAAVSECVERVMRKRIGR